jgi:hypothetical protein
MEQNSYLPAFSILVTFIVGLLTFIIGRLSVRQTGITTYINTITSERVRWMERFRQHISNFCGLSHTFYHSELNTEEGRNTEEARKVFQEIDKLRYLIRLMLKPEPDQSPDKSNKDERKINQLIDDIPKLVLPKDKMKPGEEDELFSDIKELVETSRSLLKDVWELVKVESKMQPTFCRELKEYLKQRGWL